MNSELGGRELVSENWRYDERWLFQVFEAAGVEPAFTVLHTDARVMLEQAEADRNFDLANLDQARRDAQRNRRRRADADAAIWAELWRTVTKRR
ncbi:hypothetical protein [uncultured Rhodoblastus sp.]|uniref:hypothetical protein n=1 Tax=uncultured Rhodoblastus sp. TaxID=543037 RepID=UPI0025EAA3A5|nr:hypothetical protein [uncultured Rhodoblastus sp.]